MMLKSGQALLAAVISRIQPRIAGEIFALCVLKDYYGKGTGQLMQASLVLWMVIKRFD